MNQQGAGLRSGLILLTGRNKTSADLLLGNQYQPNVGEKVLGWVGLWSPPHQGGSGCFPLPWAGFSSEFTIFFP